MSYNYDQAVQELQDGTISYLEFVLISDRLEEYSRWCAERGVAKTDASAEFFVCKCFNECMDAQNCTPATDLYL